jgi:hypothetical protein
MAVQAASLEVLEKANVPAPQARAIVQAIEIEINGARDTLATKRDFWELKAEITTLRGDMKSEIAALEGRLRAEIHLAVSGSTRQMYGALLAQMAVLLGIVYFFAAHPPH